MAIGNWTDYARLPLNTPDYGINNILPNVLKGYGIARAPGQIEEAEKAAKLANLLKQQEHENNPEDYETTFDLRRAQAEQARAHALQYENQAKLPGGGKLTAKQQELADLYGYGTPEYKTALERSHGILSGADVPEGAVPLELLSPGERNDTVKQMRNELSKANNITKAIKEIEAMKTILEKHPNMADYFTTALVDPSKATSLWGQIKRMGVNKEDLAAIEKFTKHSNALVSHAGAALGGGKQFTDKMIELISSQKPNVKSTYESNKYLLDYLYDDFIPYIKYGDAIKKGLNNRYVVVQDPEAYRKPVQENKITDQNGQLNQQNMQTFANNLEQGQSLPPPTEENTEVNTEENIAFTASKYGYTIDQVKKILGLQ